MEGTDLLPLTRRALLGRAATFTLGWLLLPERLRAGPGELRITVVTPPAGAAWEGARMGIEEATHTAGLLRRPLHIQHVELSTPDEAMAQLVGGTAVGGAVVWALETPGDRSLAARALEQAAEGLLVLDARPTHEPDAACGARTFRIGIPSPDNRAAAPELWHASLNRYGATQLNQRFLSRFGHGMDGVAWAAWFGVKVAAEVAFRAAEVDPDALAGFLTGGAAAFDGHKGRPLRFSASRHALEQPLYVPGPGDGPWEEATEGAMDSAGPVCRDAAPRERSDRSYHATRRRSRLATFLFLPALTLLQACGDGAGGGDGGGDAPSEAPRLEPGAAFVYVSNEGHGTVSILDPATDEVVGTVAVGIGPRGIQVSPSGSSVFVALSDLNRMSESDADAIVEVDPYAGRVVRQYRAGSDPEQFAVSPAGNQLYAANEDAGTASVIDRAAGSVVATLAVGIEPEGIAVSPDGRWVYVAAETSNTVSVIDTETQQVVASFLVDVRPRGVAFSPDGLRAYVSNEISGTLSVVDVADHRVVGTVSFPTGAKPVGVVVAPDGARVFVAAGGAASVFVVDPDAGAVVGRIAVGERPWGIALGPDGRRLYTANGVSDDVSVVDVATLQEVRRVRVGDRPWGVAVSSGRAGTGGEGTTGVAGP